MAILPATTRRGGARGGMLLDDHADLEAALATLAGSPAACMFMASHGRVIGRCSAGATTRTSTQVTEILSYSDASVIVERR